MTSMENWNQFVTKPLKLDPHNYGYYKVQITQLIESIDVDGCGAVEDKWTSPMATNEKEECVSKPRKYSTAKEKS